jgi:hypothetical protein
VNDHWTEAEASVYCMYSTVDGRYLAMLKLNLIDQQRWAVHMRRGLFGKFGHCAMVSGPPRH